MTEQDSFVVSQTMHFTGICGVGMTALALCLQDKGVHVCGSDTGEQFVTSSVLQSRSIAVETGFAPLASEKKIDGLIYTGSHGGSQNPQVISAKSRGIPTYSLAQALGLLSLSKKTLAVCGVGGKTTTSAMLATILQKAKLHPSYAIGVGGLSTLAFPGKWNPQGEYFIAEADEYATSPGTDATPRFMSLSPQTIICTGIAHDHPDVYANLEDVQTAFAHFFSRLKSDGLLVACGDNKALQAILERVTNVKVVRYGAQAHNDWRIVSAEITNQTQKVTITDPQATTHTMILRVPGAHNALNALAALVAAQAHGVSPELSAQALNAFTGTKRRFEVLGERAGVTYVDDYAHHPSEIQATLQAARTWYEGRRLVVIFQPHTFSRTKTLLSEFAKSFTQADVVFVDDIFASAREQFDPSIDGLQLANAINAISHNTYYEPQSTMAKRVESLVQKGDVVMTMGAGDVYKLNEQLLRGT
jgi:UDP-N-acetylmuramate--alanine ligase